MRAFGCTHLSLDFFTVFFYCFLLKTMKFIRNQSKTTETWGEVYGADTWRNILHGYVTATCNRDKITTCTHTVKCSWAMLQWHMPSCCCKVVLLHFTVCVHVVNLPLLRMSLWHVCALCHSDMSLCVSTFNLNWHHLFAYEISVWNFVLAQVPIEQFKIIM